jgi:hypothetical protein
MLSTYRSDDVTILLKDVSGAIIPMSTEEREKVIQNGGHYSEMLPIEHLPSPAYLAAFHDAISRYSKFTAAAVASVAQKIWDEKGKDAVLVSLARGGTSIGVLIKRYIRFKFNTDVEHYTVSIIRGRGIDVNAMNYILSRHKPDQIQFVDGWTGKGTIQRELRKAMEQFPDINPGLAVLSDPAHFADKCGTHEDFLIASSCLNATSSGLLSRTINRPDIIGPNDFHGVAFYGEWEKNDQTYLFIDSVIKHFPDVDPNEDSPAPGVSLSAADEVAALCKEYGITDINLIKPSIGEATRVLLRRMPWKVLVHSLDDAEHLGHIYQLAEEKGVPLVVHPMVNYKACGLIKSLGDG